MRNLLQKFFELQKSLYLGQVKKSHLYASECFELKVSFSELLFTEHSKFEEPVSEPEVSQNFHINRIIFVKMKIGSLGSLFRIYFTGAYSNFYYNRTFGGKF